MSNRTLSKIRKRVQDGKVIVTLHAREEMDADSIKREDIENAILEGDIQEEQWDNQYGHWKYLIAGEAKDGSPIEVIVRLNLSGSVVIVTVYKS